MSYLMLLDLEPALRTADWPAVLHAALTHDHGWMEWEEALLDQEGQPASFVQSSVEKGIKLSQRGIDLAEYQSVEAAVFVARHIEELYGWRPEPELAEHVAGVRERRQDLMSRCGLTEDSVERGYELVLWADSASLMLCVEDQGFVDTLKLSIGQTAYRLNGAGREWTLDPWPYQSSELRVTVESRFLRSKTFASTEDLRAALAGAEVGLREWTLRPV